MRSVNVYKRKGKLIIRAYSETVDGAWIGTLPVVVLEADAPPAEIGKTLLEVLSHSQTGIPHPTDWKSVERPILKAAGVKSTAELMKNNLSCHVEEEEGVLRFIPMENRGPKEGFVFTRNEYIITIPADSPHQKIGETLLEALNKCI